MRVLQAAGSTVHVAHKGGGRHYCCGRTNLAAGQVDAAKAQVLVGPRHLLAVRSARIAETNRIGPLPAGPLTAKVRSMAKQVPVTLEGPLGDGASCTIHFTGPEYGVAPGQAAVIYAGERVIGGGWIDSTQP